jgi:hypothetical protein
VLLTMLGCLGWEVVPISGFVDAWVASGSSPVLSFDGFADVAFMKSLAGGGGKIPSDR